MDIINELEMTARENHLFSLKSQYLDLITGKLLWREDDATRGMDGHETVTQYLIKHHGFEEYTFRNFNEYLDMGDSFVKLYKDNKLITVYGPDGYEVREYLI